MTSLIPFAEARAKLSELVGRAVDHHERIVITLHGKPAAVLLSVYDYESMVETLDLLADPEAAAVLEQAEKEVAEGLTVPMDEVRLRSPADAG